MAPPKTRLVLVRHGESQSNAEGWISDHATCGGLTDRGRAQAAALRDRLASDDSFRADVLLCSTMRRAAETAAFVGEAVGLAPIEVAELSERKPGECEGLTYDEYFDRYGRHAYSNWDDALSPGGEDVRQFIARVDAVLTELADRYDGQTAVIVCHGGVILESISLFMDVPWIGEGGPRWRNPENTSISEWSRKADGPMAPWVLERYNDHAHVTV